MHACMYPRSHPNEQSMQKVAAAESNLGVYQKNIQQLKTPSPLRVGVPPCCPRYAYYAVLIIRQDTEL